MHKLTLEDKKLIYTNIPKYGDFIFNANFRLPGEQITPVNLYEYISDENWLPNEAFWEYKRNEVK